MKNLFFGVAIVGIIVACGSVAYYYAYFLPQQNIKTQQDISAIRSVVAPSPEQQQAQVQALDAYSKCLLNMQGKGDAWLHQKCDIPNGNDMLKAMNCRSTTLASVEYQTQFGCKYPY